MQRPAWDEQSDAVHAAAGGPGVVDPTGGGADPAGRAAVRPPAAGAADPAADAGPESRGIEPPGPELAGPEPAGTGPAGTWRPMPFSYGDQRSGPDRPWRPGRRDVLAAVGAVAGLAVVGLLVGLVWRSVAPRLAYQVVAAGRAVAAAPESEEQIAADGWFAFLTFGVGVLAGLALWWLRSTRGPVAMLGLAVGGFVGAVAAWRFGVALTPGPSAAELRDIGRTVYPALSLRATAGLSAEPIGAVLVYLILVAFASRPDLGRAPSGQP